MGEYGHSMINVGDADTILKGMPSSFRAWASHGDEVIGLPPDFKALASSESCKIEAMCHKSRNIFGVQFHPEVFHTENGKLVLQNFAEICNG
jgi:GMP synthase (glutamine-hydrolysing)